MIPPAHTSNLPHDLLFPRLALAVVLLFLGGILGYTLYQEHGRIEQRERERLATQAKVIDENLGRQLDAVNLALKGIRKELPLWRGKQGLKLANLRLEAMADAMPGIRTFLITNRSGVIVACNRRQIIGQDIRHRDWLQAILKNPNPSTLSVSPPFKTMLGNFVINVGLMVPGPQGEFDGVVSAALDPEYFSILLGSVLYAPDMWAGLAHGDGKVFLRVPDLKTITGLDLAKPGYLFTRHRDSGRTDTVMIGTAPVTDDLRLMAQRTVRPGMVAMDKPLVVGVSRNLAALYADWRREALWKGALFGILVLAMTSALYLYQRRQQKFAALSAQHLEELLQAKEMALQANEAKSRFLATIAHEFRTPLSLLTSSTDILDRYGERLCTAQHTEQNGHIRSAARQMSNLIDSVLSFNQREINRPEIAPQKLDVGRICRDIAAEFSTVWGRGHVFQTSISAECGTVLLDEILFRRVLENLLTNAFRYTPTGGSVSLQVDRACKQFHIVIADSGIGIPEVDQQRIFEAFFRCQNVEARRGLGLGLSIVNDALLQMGGTITVTSIVGEGTTMRVEIPVVEQSNS